MRLVWRSSKLFEEPGLFLVWPGGSFCVLPMPKGR